MIDIYSLKDYILSNSTLTLLLITIVGSIFLNVLGYVLFKVSIFQPLEELAHRQESYRRERKLREFNIKISSYYVELGDSFLDVVQLEAAKAAYEKAFGFDPMNVDAQMGLLKSETFEPIFSKEPVYYDKEKTKKKIEIIQKYNKYDRHAAYFLGELFRTDNEENLITASEYFKNAICLSVIKDETQQENLYYFLKKKYLQLKTLAVCLNFCKITNLKKLLGRKFHIGRSIFCIVRKKLTLNLQQI
jgi:tetratricopeptide (TPR) repeat protein